MRGQSPKSRSPQSPILLVLPPDSIQVGRFFADCPAKIYVHVVQFRRPQNRGLVSGALSFAIERFKGLKALLSARHGTSVPELRFAPQGRGPQEPSRDLPGASGPPRLPEASRPQSQPRLKSLCSPYPHRRRSRSSEGQRKQDGPWTMSRGHIKDAGASARRRCKRSLTQCR
jgi:hypothetical protein